METTTVRIELNADHAWALALFLKRVGWADMRDCAKDERETYEIRAGIDAAAQALAAAGYAPR